MEHTTPLWEMALRLLAAVVGAGIVGWEREVRRRPAGLRTHILVALGAATFTLLGMEIMEMVKADTRLRFDPSRIIAGVVGGVGFLGAGAIIQGRGEVHGLTTAAALWVAAAIGVVAGTGHYALVALVAAMTFFTLTVLRVVERRLHAGESAKGSREQPPGQPRGLGD